MARSLALRFRVVENHPVTGRSVLRRHLCKRDAEKLAERCAASRPANSSVVYAVEPMTRRRVGEHS